MIGIDVPARSPLQRHFLREPKRLLKTGTFSSANAHGYSDFGYASFAGLMPTAASNFTVIGMKSSACRARRRGCCGVWCHVHEQAPLSSRASRPGRYRARRLTAARAGRCWLRGTTGSEQTPCEPRVSMAEAVTDVGSQNRVESRRHMEREAFVVEHRPLGKACARPRHPLS